jgi:hypothetical protein
MTRDTLLFGASDSCLRCERCPASMTGEDRERTGEACNMEVEPTRPSNANGDPAHEALE